MVATLTHNIGQVAAAFDRLGRNQVPFATAMALNDTAEDGFSHLQQRMGEVFDRPTRWTLNAFMVWRADKKALMAKVMERPSVGSRHYLKVQGKGGTRGQKGLEKLISTRVGYDIGAYIPVGGARLDAHGNWSNGQRNQVMSQIGAWSEVGFTANQTARSKKRNAKRAQYFVPRPGSNLHPGVYMKRGEDVDMVLQFTRRTPFYRKRIDWRYEVNDKAGKVYRDHFARRLTEALRAAK